MSFVYTQLSLHEYYKIEHFPHYWVEQKQTVLHYQQQRCFVTSIINYNGSNILFIHR